MIRRTLLIAATTMALASIPRAASAWPQTKDYFLDAPIPGTWAHVDAVTLGIQGSIEHRIPIEDENMGMFHLRGSGVASLGYSEVAAHTDLRVLGMFTVGGSVGYRNVWNNIGFPNDRSLGSRADRRNIKELSNEGRGERTSRAWPYWEARARMVIPLEMFWFVSNAAIRGENSPDNTFDWFHTNMHDGGTLYRLDATLFYRHKDFGGIGPTVRYMVMPWAGGKKRELAYGLTFGTRIGLKARNDVLLVQILARFGDDQFGWHQLGAKVPVYAMVIYRASFKLL